MICPSRYNFNSLIDFSPHKLLFRKHNPKGKDCFVLLTFGELRVAFFLFFQGGLLA